MTVERRREVVEYFDKCKVCDKEFEVSLFAPHDNPICHHCKVKARVEKARKSLNIFIGAVVTEIDPVVNDMNTFSDRIDYIALKLVNGKEVLISGNSWTYIE